MNNCPSCKTGKLLLYYVGADKDYYVCNRCKKIFSKIFIETEFDEELEKSKFKDEK